jgi:hypothetical protein
MTLSLVAPSATAERLPLRKWAESVGLPLSTAKRWALHGQLDGSDREHPHAYRDDAGKWWVAPHVYRVIEEVPATPGTPAETPDLTALIDARIRAYLAERLGA